MTGEEYSMISAIANIVVAVSAFGGAIIAMLGLNAWHKQLKGTTEYDLARQLLKHVYRLREEVGYVRAPFLSVQEAQDVPDGMPWEVVAYENRWKNLKTAMVDFWAVGLECEVLWGKDFVDMRTKLNGMIIKLRFALDMYESAKTDPSLKGVFTKEQRAILYKNMENDVYTDDFDNLIVRFEDYVKPHLKRR